MLFQKFPTSKWNSDTVSYMVEWQKVNSQVSYTGLLEEPNAVIYTTTLGTELYTQYRVRVQAKNGEGEGPFSEWALIYSYQEGRYLDLTRNEDDGKNGEGGLMTE